MNNKERNKAKKAILEQLTHDEHGIFSKHGGWAIYNNTDLEMVMQCVVDGLTKYAHESEKQEIEK